MKKKLFVLDTNVLMHDPTALFAFHEHDLFLPMVVLEELDQAKKGTSDAARNARQASRFLEELTRGRTHAQIEKGLPLTGARVAGAETLAAIGKLFLQTHAADVQLPAMLPGAKPDNNILLAALAAQATFTSRGVILVSKDINLRIKAAVVGVRAEDFQRDQVLDDLSLLPAGFSRLPDDFWSRHGEKMESWRDPRGRTHYRVHGPMVKDWRINEFLYLHEEAEAGLELMVKSLDAGQQIAELMMIKDYRRAAVWGIHAKNREQNFALNLLMDPDIDFVSLLGAAGTGKTLLTLAAALAQSSEENRYKEIIMTRVTVPLGDDIGFLPGTEEEKMTPWMGALMDNLEVLAKDSENSGWHRATLNEQLANRIRIRSINFMRGRTFLNRFIILDEAQNLTPKQMKALVTRAGPGTKLVALGNLSQIDTPYLSETTSGLTYVVDRFAGWPHGGQVTLARGERSRLAAFASDVL